MSHDAKIETLNGTLRQLLFSPKGGIEGMLLKVGSKLLQVSMESSTADARTLAAAVGKAVEVTASADHSPKTKGGVHPVYKLDGLTQIAGKPVKAGEHPVTGVVATLHYAKHGEPNGVILESGEFIHTRPPGMKKLKLEVGSKVVAHGELRMTVLGTPLLEAHEVNRMKLE